MRLSMLYLGELVIFYLNHVFYSTLGTLLLLIWRTLFDRIDHDQSRRSTQSTCGLIRLGLLILSTDLSDKQLTNTINSWSEEKPIDLTNHDDQVNWLTMSWSKPKSWKDQRSDNQLSWFVNQMYRIDMVVNCGSSLVKSIDCSIM